MTLYLKMTCMGECTGISFVDSTTLKVCNNRRIHSHKDPLMNSNLLGQVQGKLFCDRGYLSQKLFEMLFVDGIHLITKIRSNMKNSLMSLENKVLLRKRALIESINNELKNICQIEHSRHRSFSNFVVNLISSLVAYSFFPKKPAIQFESVNSQ